MDSNRAYEILKISPPFDIKQLKKHYYKAALKHHPDKNEGIDTNGIFQEVQEAYSYLCTSINSDKRNTVEESYVTIIQNFIRIWQDNSCDAKTNTNCETDTYISILINILKNGCRSISLKSFEGINKQQTQNLYGFIVTYADLFGFDNEIITSIREIIKERFHDDEVIILNPSLDNLLNADVYKLNYKEELLYVPLWHDEITYDLSGCSLFVKCIPKIDEHVSIDEHNTIHVSISISVLKLLEIGYVDILLGSKQLRIHGYDLKISSKQVYTLHKVGIPAINIHKTYDEKIRRDIVFHITLNK